MTLKKLYGIVLVIMLALVAGCSSGSEEETPEYQLEITDGVEIVLDEDSDPDQTIGFTYRRVGKTGSELTSDDFTATWSQNNSFSRTVAPHVEYDSATGKGTISYSFDCEVYENKTATITLREKKHGKSVKINLYFGPDYEFSFPKGS